MKNIKAFTLVELLVVVAIIALLLALLIPSLGKARELANRIVCKANIKNIATASNSYSHTYDGYFVPFCQVGWGRPALMLGDYSNNPEVGDHRWFQNKAFRSYIKIDSYQVSSNLWSFPKKFLCPSDKISKSKPENTYRMSYAYNNTDWRPWTIAYRIVGYKVSTVIKPAETLNFIDSITFDVDINGAHYIAAWDRVKDILLNPSMWPWDPDLGSAFYRHNEGANVGFYDGHAQWLHKTDAFDIDGYCAEPARMGMWTASGRIIPGWFRRWQSFCP